MASSSGKLKARVKLPPLLLVDDDPETIYASPPAAPDESPAVTLNAPPMSVPEPTEIAMLPPEPDADELWEKGQTDGRKVPTQKNKKRFGREDRHDYGRKDRWMVIKYQLKKSKKRFGGRTGMTMGERTDGW